MPGAPTLYLASERGVAIAEWGRHLERDVPHVGAGAVQERALYAITLTLDGVLDLRERAVTDGLGLTDAPGCFLDRAVARATAGFIRHTTRSQGLLVPSVAFLDDLDRWNLVVFLEKLGAPLDSVATARRIGAFRVLPDPQVGRPGLRG